MLELKLGVAQGSEAGIAGHVAQRVHAIEVDGRGAVAGRLGVLQPLHTRIAARGEAPVGGGETLGARGAGERGGAHAMLLAAQVGHLVVVVHTRGSERGGRVDGAEELAHARGGVILVGAAIDGAGCVAAQHLGLVDGAARLEQVDIAREAAHIGRSCTVDMASGIAVAQVAAQHLAHKAAHVGLAVEALDQGLGKAAVDHAHRGAAKEAAHQQVGRAVAVDGIGAVDRAGEIASHCSAVEQVAHKAAHRHALGAAAVDGATRGPGGFHAAVLNLAGNGAHKAAQAYHRSVLDRAVLHRSQRAAQAAHGGRVATHAAARDVHVLQRALAQAGHNAGKVGLAHHRGIVEGEVLHHAHSVDVAKEAGIALARHVEALDGVAPAVKGAGKGMVVAVAYRLKHRVEQVDVARELEIQALVGAVHGRGLGPAVAHIVGIHTGGQELQVGPGGKLVGIGSRTRPRPSRHVLRQ